MRSLAGVAQLVEQLIRNEKVVGSTPISGTTSCLFSPSLRLDNQVLNRGIAHIEYRMPRRARTRKITTRL